MFDKDVYMFAEDLAKMHSIMEHHPGQDVYLIEEMSELTKELMKVRRRKGNQDLIEKEIADVYVTLIIYCIDMGVDLDRLKKFAMFKIERGIEKLKKGEM